MSETLCASVHPSDPEMSCTRPDGHFPEWHEQVGYLWDWPGEPGPDGVQGTPGVSDE